MPKQALLSRFFTRPGAGEASAPAKRKAEVVDLDDDGDDDVAVVPAKRPPPPPPPAASPKASPKAPKKSPARAAAGGFAPDLAARRAHLASLAPAGAPAAASDEDEGSPEPASKRSKTKAAKVKYTPLEQQVLAVRSEHPDLLLVVEVGYRYRFFGRDAEEASRLLSIMTFQDKNFLSASIPVGRLNVHIRRLVEAGHKVGVVGQTEKAALKSTAGPFARSLTQVFTKATVPVDDDLMQPDGAALSSYMMAIVPSATSARFGVVAVCVSSGDVIYDVFDDDAVCTQLHTRLLHIDPSEVLLSVHDQLPAAARKLVDAAEQARIEVVSGPSSADDARALLKTAFPALDAAPILEHDVVAEALGVVLVHLQQLRLDGLLRLRDRFRPFATTRSMLLSGNTLASLELFHTDLERNRGSLVWLLDHTKSRFGARLLREWIAHPLLDRQAIAERHQAVAVLSTPPVPEPLVRLRASVLGSLPDLERALVRIHYGRCRPKEFWLVLAALHKVLAWSAAAAATATALAEQAPLLASLIGGMDPDGAAAKRVAAFMAMLSQAAAERDEMAGLIRDTTQFTDIADNKRVIAEQQTLLQDHLAEIRRVLHAPAAEYKSVSQEEYLIEVPIRDEKKVPADWSVINSTKKCKRYRSPVVVKAIKAIERHKELLAEACQRAWLEIQADFASAMHPLKQIVANLAVLDCLQSLAHVAQTRPGYVRPELVDTPRFLKVEQARHPLVEAVLSSPFVPNDVHLGPGSLAGPANAMIITGPNMGGKSSYTRMVALLVIMAQIGSFVPAQSAVMGVFDAVMTRMGAQDNLQKGLSTFMVELSETALILKAATNRSLVILDELGRGTSTFDGAAIAHATLEHVACDLDAAVLFVTHYPQICVLQDQLPDRVQNYHMSYLARRDPDSGEESVTFLYLLAPGMASRSYGLNVARMAGVPQSIVALAMTTATEFEQRGRAAAIAAALHTRSAAPLRKALLAGPEDGES